MKRFGTLLLLPLLLLLAATAAHARDVTVAWDPNPPAENVTGYVLHYGATSRATPGFSGYDTQVDVHNVTETTLDLAPGTYLALTAYNAAGLSSDYSVELQVQPVPTSPGSPSDPVATTTVTDGLGRTVTVTVTVRVE